MHPYFDNCIEKYWNAYLQCQWLPSPVFIKYILFEMVLGTTTIWTTMFLRTFCSCKYWNTLKYRQLPTSGKQEKVKFNVLNQSAFSEYNVLLFKTASECLMFTIPILEVAWNNIFVWEIDRYYGNEGFYVYWQAKITTLGTGSEIYTYSERINILCQHVSFALLVY